MRATFSSTIASTASRIMTATASMLHVHASRDQPVAPTPERAAKGEIRPPTRQPGACRDAFNPVDAISKHGLPRHPAAVLSDYVRERLAEATASLALNSYEFKVDNGGWRGDVGFDGRDESAGEDKEDESVKKAAELARIHKGLTPRMRALADALVDTIGEMQLGNSLDAAIREIVSRSDSADTREGAMRASLYWLADQLQYLRRK